MTLIYILCALVALGFLVFIHELGHYFAAKLMGMRVETFSIGFGRPIRKWRRGEVDWQVGWLPFGGYVKITGMEFSKKEREKGVELYDIPHGFFSKSPWRRIFVAAAGPLANLLLAFLLFVCIWMAGGREKPFSEYTQIVGWVDPHSELYSLGVRPGDLLTEYNGHPFRGAKDLIYAAMLQGETVTLKGYHINYQTKERRPFSYTVESYPLLTGIEGMRTTGVTASARYLIFDRLPHGEANTLPEGSSLRESGILYGDQLVWADGQLLFSLEQLSALLNQGDALLTVERGDRRFLSRQPRLRADELLLPSYLHNELTDWQYEAEIKGRWQELVILPYVINSEGYVENTLPLLDKESLRTRALPWGEALEPGDRIVAVDGSGVTQGYEILRSLQKHRVQLVVHRSSSPQRVSSWKEEDSHFLSSLSAPDSEAAASGLSPSPEWVLLRPVEPQRAEEFLLSKAGADRVVRLCEEQVEGVEEQERRAKVLRCVEQSHQRLLLGIYLQDRLIAYNPSPFALFGATFTETWQTLRALVLGHLQMRWMSGPIGIVQVLHHGWEVGATEAFFWIAAISVNLGVVNLLPIPVLDGGYITLSLWELVTRRRIRAKTLERLIVPFVVLLIGLILFLTLQDLFRLF